MERAVVSTTWRVSDSPTGIGVPQREQESAKSGLTVLQ
jgi:hypothetical protein